jgi:hypothetical protein
MAPRFTFCALACEAMAPRISAATVKVIASFLIRPSSIYRPHLPRLGSVVDGAALGSVTCCHFRKIPKRNGRTLRITKLPLLVCLIQTTPLPCLRLALNGHSAIAVESPLRGPSGHERRYWIIPRVMALIWGTRHPQCMVVQVGSRRHDAKRADDHDHHEAEPRLGRSTLEKPSIAGLFSFLKSRADTT